MRLSIKVLEMVEEGVCKMSSSRVELQGEVKSLKKSLSRANEERDLL